MWLDVAIAMSCGGAGLICGWIMHAIGGLGGLQSSGHDRISKRQATEELDRNQEQISEVAQRLQTYALSMAADVDAHQTKMQAVNHTLAQRDDSSHEAVLRAVSDLIEANEEMQTQLKQAQDRIHEQTVQIESAELRAQTDALTRVANRRAFDDHIEARVALGPSQAGTLALLDVDHFKKFNDIYGHRAGDQVLRVVASILHSRLQSYGLVARFGGEEFAIILDGIPVDNAKSLVERARIAIGERDMSFESKRLRVSASIGVAQYTHGKSISDWIQQADEALYRSKDAGRDCGHWMNGSNPVRIDIGRRTSSGAFQGWETGEEAGNQGLASRIGQAMGAASDLHSVAELPDARVLGSIFDHMRSRAQSGVSIVLMAIRCHGEIAESTLRCLLRVARSNMRSVDRIGCADDSTLLLCMPSVDIEMAMRRGRQICRSAEAIGLGWNGIGTRPLSVGIVHASTSESFLTLVSRSILHADQAKESFADPIGVARET